jgi:hypothetical protein
MYVSFLAFPPSAPARGTRAELNASNSGAEHVKTLTIMKPPQASRPFHERKDHTQMSILAEIKNQSALA